MTDRIVFDEEYDETPLRQNRALRGFAGRLVTWGIVKDEHGANYILLGVAVFCMFIAMAVFIKGSSSSNAYGNYDAMRATHPELFKNNPPPTR